MILNRDLADIMGGYQVKELFMESVTHNSPCNYYHEASAVIAQLAIP